MEDACGFLRPTLPMTNHYRLLGVRPTASAEEIRAAYLALIKLYHPDAAGPYDPEREEKAQELNRAYSVLRDSAKRAEHDAALGLGRPAAQPRPVRMPPQPMPDAFSPRPRGPSRRVRTVTALLAAIGLGSLIGVLVSAPPGSLGRDSLPAAAKAPEKPRQPPVDDRTVMDAGSDAEFLSVEGGPLQAAEFSRNCFNELAEAPTLRLLDRCIVFDLAASRWLVALQRERETGHFRQALMDERHAAAFRRLGFDNGSANERLRKLERLTITELTLRMQRLSLPQ